MDNRENNFEKIQSFEGLSIKSYPFFIASFLNDLANLYTSLEIDLHHQDYLWIAYGNDGDAIWFIGIDQIHLDLNGDAFFYVYESSAYNPLDRNKETRVPLSSEEDSFKVFKDMFDSWTSELEKYDDLKFINPIDRRIKKYQNEYELKLEFINSDDDNSGYFDLDIQIKLDEYFKFAYNKLDEFKTDDNSEEITEIKNDFNDLVANQTLYTKGEIKVKLAKAWAKCREIDVTLAVEITKVIISEVFKKMLIG